MPSFPGHGGRALPVGGELTLEALADDVVDAHPGSLDVIGVSLGAAVAQHVAVRHPGRVRSLALCCGSLPPGPDDERARQVLRDRATETTENGMGPTVRPTLDRWFTTSALSVADHPGVEYARRVLCADDPTAVAATWQALAANAIRERLGEIKAPVTVLGARGDLAAPPERVLPLFQQLPTARLEIVNGPHMLPLEEPRAFADAVNRHLAWVQSQE